MNQIIPENITTEDLKQNIYIKNAQSNNLKGIDVLIPKNQLVVVTGLSGSGKSSLIMETLYAEGQRRYVESLSSYARQFLSRMKKPDVEYIKGICPAIAIEQRVTSSNARSTVGSLTEINDFIRLLYARIGKTISPISGKEVKKHSVTDVVDFVLSQKEGTKMMLLAPIHIPEGRTIAQTLNLLMQKGYTRIKTEDGIQQIQDLDSPKGNLFIVVDRIVAKDDDELRSRLGDSVATTFAESGGDCLVEIIGGTMTPFNNRFELDGMTFLEPSQRLFNPNNPYGACPTCEGYGKVLGIDPKKVIPDTSRSVYDGAVACWKGNSNSTLKRKFVLKAVDYDFPVHKPYSELTEEQKDLLWNGARGLYGINNYFDDLQSKLYKIQNRVMLARYRGKTDCHDCKGSRLRKEALYVKIDGRSIDSILKLPLNELHDFFKNIKLSDHDHQIAERILEELNNRLQTIHDVGLTYLTLDRLSNTLSGGETQRINLTRILGSNLTNSLYILDEPSIGLHPKDTDRLVRVLKRLRDLKNTVVVVEHEEDIVRAADHIIDIGPKAGRYGGELVYAGGYNDFLKSNVESLTKGYLTEELQHAIPKRRKIVNKLTLSGATEHNLKNVDVDIPLNALTVVCGVSGSGKTTMIKNILYPALKSKIGQDISESPGAHRDLTGDFSTISEVELISQSPLGRSSRSNPVTYVKAYDDIRKIFASQQLSKIKGLQPKHFSFNVEGGRCESCKGDGYQVIEMQFLSDVKLICEECKGYKFKNEILDIKYKGKNIYDVLELSIDEAIEFFEDNKSIVKKIKPLQDVGLGYVKLGQSSSTLSGGEAQRVKLAFYLAKQSRSKGIFFIFDEPTTGLHFHDVAKLMDALNALVEKGHSVLVVEHNMDVIAAADYLIELGPEGGKNGGHLVYQGTPEGLTKIKTSPTASYLKEKLSLK